MYFDINIKLLFGKNTQKVCKQTKYSGFVKKGVRRAEQGIYHENRGFGHFFKHVIKIKKHSEIKRPIEEISNNVNLFLYIYFFF